MKLIQHINYSLNKNDKIDMILDKIEDALNRHRKEDTKNYFFISDSSSTYEGSVSSVSRILKKFPELMKFEIVLEENNPGIISRYKALTNLPSHNKFSLYPEFNGKCFEDVGFEVLKKIALLPLP